MTQKKHTPTYTAEFRARGVGLFKENRTNYPSNNAAYKAIASKLGCSGDSLRAWCRQAERDAGERSGLTSDEKVHLKALERENRELRQANEILKKASAYFAAAERAKTYGARSANGELHQREPRGFWCRANLQGFAAKALGALATYYARVAIMRDPELASDRAKSDAADCEDIKRIFKSLI